MQSSRFAATYKEHESNSRDSDLGIHKLRWRCNSLGHDTIRHPTSNLDTLSQIVPIGNAIALMNSIQNWIPKLTTPAVTDAESKLLKKRSIDSQGVVVTHIPGTVSDPYQCNSDEAFYMRVADGFQKMPYAILQRMFASSPSSDVHLRIDSELISRDTNGDWTVALTFENHSSKSAVDVEVMVEITNRESISNVRGLSIRNVSNINPGRTIFSQSFLRPLHKGNSTKLGDLVFSMLGRKRIAKFNVMVFADQMRARTFEVRIDLHASGVSGYISDPIYLF